MHTVFGLLAAGVSFLAYVFLVRDTRRKATPPLFSWGIWSFLMITATLTTEGSARGLPLSYAIADTLFFAFLFVTRSGKREWTWVETTCGLLAAAALGLYAFVHGSDDLALGLCIFADAMGAVPTFRGVTKDPASKSRWAWALFFLGGLLNFGAAESGRFTAWGYSTYISAATGYIGASASHLVISNKDFLYSRSFDSDIISITCGKQRNATFMIYVTDLKQPLPQMQKTLSTISTKSLESIMEMLTMR